MAPYIYVLASSQSEITKAGISAGFKLTHLGSNRTERKENARWAFLAKGPDCREGFEPIRNNQSRHLCRLQVDPPGLEPGLCGTKIRRVTSYTMGQSAPDKAVQK